MNNVVLYSGGLDSFLVHHILKQRGIDHKLLYFYLDGKYSFYEQDLFDSYEFRKTIGEVETSDNLNMGNLEEDSAFIPNRNLLTAIMAHSVTKFDTVWIGGTLSDRVNDNNPKVFDTLSDLLSQMYGKRILFTSPFWTQHKADIVKDYVKSNGFGSYANEDDARRAIVNCTFSCYYPVDEDHEVIAFYSGNKLSRLTNECECCPACFRKNMSLYAGGIFIPMKDCEKSHEHVKHYYEEAQTYIKQIDEGLTTEKTMLPRMDATVQYCNELFKYWGHNV